MLNMLGKGDISKESYDEIVNLCKRCSREAARNRSKTGIPHFQEFKNQPVEGQQDLK
jgi:hypothetical protein